MARRSTRNQVRGRTQRGVVPPEPPLVGSAQGRGPVPAEPPLFSELERRGLVVIATKSRKAKARKPAR